MRWLYSGVHPFWEVHAALRRRNYDSRLEQSPRTLSYDFPQSRTGRRNYASPVIIF